jgi:micrococcal nuclease
LRNWLLTSPLRLQILVVAVVLLGTVGIATGALLLLGGVSPQQGSQADTAPTPGSTATPAPTGTPAPTATPVPTTADTAGDYRAATVVGATTGGVVAVRFDDGSVRRHPLAAVDVPDANGDNPREFDGVLAGAAGRACLGAYGQRAAIDLANRLVGESVGVRVVGDDTVVGNVGLFVRNRGQIVNRELVRRGYARPTTDRYADETDSAREGEQGLWECGTVEPGARNGDVPSTVTVRPTEAAATGGLRVMKVRPNPAGSGERRLADEVVVLRNTGDSTVFLDRWTIGNDAGTTRGLDAHTTPENRRLQPGERLVVHTGRGSPADGHLYLAHPNDLWGDDGGVVRLVNRRDSPPRTVTVRYGSALPDDRQQIRAHSPRDDRQ